MKFFISTILFILGLNAFPQDITKLSEVQIIGTKSTYLDPVSLTSVRTDSIESLYQGQDPFYTFSKISPNIYSQSDNGSGNGYSYIRMRGLDQTRINFTLNGIPLNEMEDQGIYFSNIPGIYSNIGNIQIERGVGTSKYGTTSVVGSINLETKNVLNKEAFLDFGYGSYNTSRLNCGFSSGLLGSNIAFSMRGSIFGTDGFKNNSGNRGGHAFYEFGYFGKRNIIKVYGFSGGSQNQMAYTAPTMDSINTNYRFNSNIPSEKDTFSQNFVTLNWINFSKEKLTSNTSIYFNNIRGNYSVKDWGLMGVKSYQGGFASNVVYCDRGININGGFNYNYYKRFHEGPFYDDIYNYNGQYHNFGEKQDFTIYTKANILVGDEFYLFGDLQYRFVDFKYQGHNFINNFVNPKVGVKWIREDGRYYNDVYFSLSYTHREPTRSDMFGGEDNPNIYKNLINLKSEKITDIELGTNFRYCGIKISANYYMMYFTNEYVSTGQMNLYGIMIKQTYTNSIRTGVEADISYKIHGFMIGTNLSGSYNKIYDSYGISHTPYASPNFTMNNFISYEHKYFCVGLNGNMNSKMFLDNTETQNTPKNYIVNAFVGVRYKNISVITNFNNISNQKYYIPAGLSSSGLGTYYVGSLFNYSLTMKLKF